MSQKTIHNLKTPLTNAVIKKLHAGDSVLLSGVIFSARDTAHQRMIAALSRREKIPFDLKGQIIFYAGPAPTRPGQVIGAIGPTTSGRMDVFTPPLLDAGLKGMIGKGARSEIVIESIQKNIAVYFGAIGGVAALLSKCIKEVEIIAYQDLGPEAVRRMVVQDFPVVVANDCYGVDIYKTGRENFLHGQ